MSQVLRCLNTYQTDPYSNLALEELLFRQVQPDEIILYLWQNRRTVVIGRNQNPWRECRVDELEKEGGFLARRRSGGGAVYHDLGNLNFTFIAHDAYYDVSKQLDVIAAAIQKLGLTVERSGRNDMTVAGRKFSGNAFQSKEGRGCHHGTLLINVDRDILGHYLVVSEAKMQSKGVRSVQARVANLCEFVPDLTVHGMRKLLMQAFGEVYGGVTEQMSEIALESRLLAALRREFASWQWRFGRPIDFTTKLQQRFNWGEIELQLQVSKGVITAAAAYSDALHTELIAALSDALPGLPFKKPIITKAVSQLPYDDEQARQIIADICTLILSE